MEYLPSNRVVLMDARHVAAGNGRCLIRVCAKFAEMLWRISFCDFFGSIYNMGSSQFRLEG